MIQLICLVRSLAWYFWLPDFSPIILKVFDADELPEFVCEHSEISHNNYNAMTNMP